MAQLAIDVLWLLIGVIILAGVVWLAIWVIGKFIYEIPERVQQAIWVVLLLLVLIALIGIVTGGGSSLRSPSFWRHSSVAGWSSWASAADLSGVLTC